MHDHGQFVEEVMTTTPVTISSVSPLNYVVELMKANGIKLYLLKMKIWLWELCHDQIFCVPS